MKRRLFIGIARSADGWMIRFEAMVSNDSVLIMVIVTCFLQLMYVAFWLRFNNLNTQLGFFK
jgi:hypothetical protein